MEKERNTLLDVITESLQRQGKTELLDRIVYVGRLTDVVPNRKDFSSYFESFFTKYHHDVVVPESVTTGSNVTGILLVLQQTCLHFIEGSSKTLKAHIRDLHSTPKAKRIIDDIKIIVATEDIPYRAFPSWVTRVLNIGRNVTPSDPPSEIEDLEPQISETYLNLLQLGRGLSEQDPGRLEEVLDALRTRYKDQLPSNEQLNTFIQSDDTFEIGEWLEVYDSPIDIQLERDLIWPVPS